MLTDALRLEIEDGVIERERANHLIEPEQLRAATEEQAREVAEEQFALDLKNARDDAAEQRDANKEFRQTLVELNKQLRGLNAERDAEKLKLETTARAPYRSAPRQPRIPIARHRTGPRREPQPVCAG